MSNPSNYQPSNQWSVESESDQDQNLDSRPNEPRIVFQPDDNHQHFYMERFTDLDGRISCICNNCPMGKTFNPVTHHLVKGEIIGR